MAYLDVFYLFISVIYKASFCTFDKIYTLWDRKLK